jgi:hypothetical protein
MGMSSREIRENDVPQVVVRLEGPPRGAHHRLGSLARPVHRQNLQHEQQVVHLVVIEVLDLGLVNANQLRNSFSKEHVEGRRLAAFDILEQPRQGEQR